ncbi:MAG: DUF433 domain-containing protein [Hyphomicrobiales bacterium]|nr:DUF433 domain-containing protein [Hyphomicrobiales bacterium]
MLERIVSDPEICGGRPCIKGTRMRVTDILDLLAAGEERSTILQDFDYLTNDDITAAILYATKAVDHRVIRAA